MPPIQMRRLFETCGSTFKWFVKIHQGTHNDSWQIHPYAYYDVSHRKPFLQGHPQTLKAFMKSIDTEEAVQSVKTLEVGQPTRDEAVKDVRELSEVTARAPRFYESALRQLKRFELPITKE